MSNISFAFKAIGVWGIVRIAIGWFVCLCLLMGWCIVIHFVVIRGFGAPNWIWVVFGPPTVLLAGASLWALVDGELDRPGGYRDVLNDTLLMGLKEMQQDRYNRHAVRLLLKSIPGADPGEERDDF
jgi:hypothetical protein